MDVNGCKWCLIPSLRTESIPLNRRQNPHLWMSASLVIISLVKLSCWRVSSWGAQGGSTVLSLHSLLVKSFLLAFNGQICIFFLDFLGESPGFSWIFPWFKQQVIGIQAEFHLGPAPFFGPSNAGHEATEEVPRARVRAECGAEHVEDSIGLKMMGKPLEKSQNMSEMMGKWWEKPQIFIFRPVSDPFLESSDSWFKPRMKKDNQVPAC